ncbi:MAG: PxKF domain-containing protein [Propionibacteriales bacterium]|nr:PxKF domain-containing protein [Propionibacteriales bacterium]
MLALAAVIPTVVVTGLGGAANAATDDYALLFVAGTGTAGAPTAGPATSSNLFNPYGVAVDGSGNVYIADTVNNRVEKVTPGGQLSVIAGTGDTGAPTEGPATSSNLDLPIGVAVDGSGNVYIADYGNNRVEQVTPGGQLSVIAGTSSQGAPTAGPATSSNLNSPAGVAVDGSGNVYIADQGNHRVEQVTPGGQLSVIAGTGVAGAPTAGPATSSNLDNPTGVVVDGTGNVYIADGRNNQVEKVTPGGQLSVIAGTGAAGAPTAGPATSSNLRTPFGVAVDGSGNVYIADTSNHRVEKVTPGGQLSVIAGTGAAGAPTAGPATSSNLSYPTGVAVDGTGNVYIADFGNHRVEKLVAPPPATIYAFGLQQPLNADGSSIVKGNSTVPVKFTLKANGVATTSPVAYFSATKVSSSISGDDLETLPSTTPSTGTVFAISAGVYQYNWSTKGLASGTYRIKVTLDNGATYSVNVSLK